MKKYLNTSITLFLLATVLAYADKIHAMEEGLGGQCSVSGQGEELSQNIIPQKWRDQLLRSYVEENNTDECKALLQLGANPSAQRRDGRETALFLAIRHIPIMKIFLKYVDPNTQDYTGNTLLNKACKIGNINLAHLFLEAGTNPTIENRDEETPLITALYENAPEIIELLLQHNVPTNTSRFKTQPLHIAINRGIPSKTVKALLDHGADPFRTTDIHLCHPIQVTALELLNERTPPNIKIKDLLEQAEENWRITATIWCIKKNEYSVPEDIMKLIALAIRTSNKEYPEEIRTEETNERGPVMVSRLEELS